MARVLTPGGQREGIVGPSGTCRPVRARPRDGRPLLVPRAGADFEALAFRGVPVVVGLSVAVFRVAVFVVGVPVMEARFVAVDGVAGLLPDVLAASVDDSPEGDVDEALVVIRPL
ncbi:MAG TPA: hypothetical protein VMI11_05755 [Actinomycetes bacterium]|nr:hypothetical protein [Actinomycetes bacterium]